MKVIFLDRDGVINIPKIINRKPFAPTNISQFRFYPYTKKNCYQLRKLGYYLIIITNQPDISKGFIKLQELKKMHQKVIHELKILRVYTSYSSNNNNKNRKPNPGLLLKAIKDFNINVDKSFMIGDRKKDIDAANKIGCRSIFIDRKYLETKPNNQLFTCKSFNEAVKIIQNMN